ncbi:MAG: fibronectin type III domain-containing protein [Deltaproteobacteria bacterium]|nr:fibronectin type III domain-containing protein [Deltaproteobacteria bacterium]
MSNRLCLQVGVWSPSASGPELKRSLLILLFISVSVFFLSACGRKTDVRPPELVGPEPIGDLTLEATDKTIQLHWGRPQKYVDGSDMDDLGGFVVLRATENGQGKAGVFARIATVPVEDRDRFRKAKKFSYTDEQLTAGTLYRYRVEAFTLDGYYSSPSNTVELAWQGGP